MVNRIALLLIILVSLFVATTVFAEIIIRAKDGRSFTVPLNGDEVESIDFNGEDSSTKEALSSPGKEVTDYKGNKVFLPCGDLAFADRVASFNVGTPSPVQSAMNPYKSLGPNDYNESVDDGYVTLGCGGSITLEFSKIYLVDKEGVDLHVFEIGPAVESTRLEISIDGVNWVNIGRVSGGKASVDISGYVNPSDKFRFVRLTDLKTGCNGDWPGADIDAVAAIGCVSVN